MSLDEKKSFSFFRTKYINLKRQKFSAQTVFIVAHTEHRLPLAEAHRQSPTNTWCTFSHSQTETHSNTLGPRLSAPFLHFIKRRVAQRSQVGTLLWMAESTPLVSDCAYLQLSKPCLMFLLEKVREKLLKFYLNFPFCLDECHCIELTKTRADKKAGLLL